MTDETIAQKFLEHLASQGHRLQRGATYWIFENSHVALPPDRLEHILRTYLLEADIPQSIKTVANITMILRVMLDPHPLMLDPHPLGKIDKGAEQAKEK